MLKERAISFYNTNKEKYRWLINKYVALWFMNATEDQIHRVCKTLTSGNISIGKRGITIFFYDIYKFPAGEESHYFHPHSCTFTLDIHYHGIFMGRDVINYREFENVWNRDIDPKVYTTS